MSGKVVYSQLSLPVMHSGVGSLSLSTNEWESRALATLSPSHALGSRESLSPIEWD